MCELFQSIVAAASAVHHDASRRVEHSIVRGAAHANADVHMQESALRRIRSKQTVDSMAAATSRRLALLDEAFRHRHRVLRKPMFV